MPPSDLAALRLVASIRPAPPAAPPGPDSPIAAARPGLPFPLGFLQPPAYLLEATIGDLWALELVNARDPDAGTYLLRPAAIAAVGVPPPLPNLPSAKEAHWITYAPVALPDGSNILTVYAALWPGPRDSLRIKLVVVPTPLHGAGATYFRLRRMVVLRCTIVPNYPVVKPSEEDTAFRGTFRLYPALETNAFLSGVTNHALAYPSADWHLSFWSLYHASRLSGLMFVWDDRAADPRNGPHVDPTGRPRGFAPALLRVTRRPVGEMSPVGLAGPAIDLEFAQLPSTDYTIPSAAAPLPPCVQSGSLALLPVEEGRGYAFTHWYDLLLLYREFALSSPVVAARRADPVTPAFEDVALALGPLGEYSLASPAAGGDFTKEHNERTVSFLEEVVLPSGTRPLVFYFNNWGLLDAPGPVPPPCPNRPPAPNPGAWAGLRPGVADLTRRVHEVGGLAMGYIHSYSFSPEWPEIDDDWALLDVAGNRARSDTEVWYCHATPESKRIWHELLVPGALEERPDGGMLDGLHVDGVNGADHCADGGQSPPDLHGHRLQTNELVEALDAYLEYARFRNVPGRRDRRFFDQEIPVEALLHRFDSSAQSQPLGQPAFPRLHRMVYGNLTRYSFVGYLFGQNPAANEYELFDMRGLAVLAEGGLPLYFYWDSPESPILNPAANPRTVGMLQAYLSNYRKVLAPVFAMDLLPAPRLDPRVERSPPECGFYYRGDLFTERDRFAREILPTDPLVHGAAFGDGRRAAVVLVNWATPIVGVPPPRVGTVRTVRVPPPCGVVTTSELSAITGDSMRSSLPVTVELDARVLRLDPSAPYPLRLFALNAGAPPQELPVVVEGEPDPELQGRALARFDLPSPSLAVLYVG